MPVCVCFRLDLVQMYYGFHPAAEPDLLMFLGFFAAGWAVTLTYYVKNL